MLWVAEFPIFVIFFFGIFAYFLLRMFATGSKSETREVFEFYLTANEILRDDDRRWFGFEVNEAIRRGEDIVERMSPAPPLVYFALGALQNKAGNHKAAVGNLAYVIENANADESAYAFSTPELRSYVRVLRKIERDPADAPLTSAAVRALERARKIRGAVLLEESRHKFSTSVPQAEGKNKLVGDVESAVSYEENGDAKETAKDISYVEAVTIEPVPAGELKKRPSSKRPKSSDDPFSDRKPISEVLHDIYDKNVQ